MPQMLKSRKCDAAMTTNICCCHSLVDLNFATCTVMLSMLLNIFARSSPLFIAKEWRVSTVFFSHYSDFPDT